MTYQLWREKSNEQPSDLPGDLMATKDVYEPVPHAFGFVLLEPCRPRKTLIRTRAGQVQVHNLPGTQGKRHEA
jgi:hypothetical protein